MRGARQTQTLEAAVREDHIVMVVPEELPVNLLIIRFVLDDQDPLPIVWCVR